MHRYPRDLNGYSGNPPRVNWPNNAKIAVQFVLNYEEGGENSLLHGDPSSEAFLSEIVGAQPWPGMRHWNMESIYDYGARSGFWRIRDVFAQADIPLTIYGVATALARSPNQVAEMKAQNWEIASHGLKWIDYKDFGKEEERAHIKAAIELHEEVVGAPPRGWYTGRCSEHTVDLVTEEGCFDYISDCYDDDLPYWRGQQLMVPYTLDANDMRFASLQGFNSGDQFFSYLKDSFDALYEEGEAGFPKMMSIGLHCRLIGRPGRIQSLKRFLNYAKSHGDVWFARRIDIAQHWAQEHPKTEPNFVPTEMHKATFMKEFGGIFEHSAWVAEGAYQLELGPAHNSALGLHNALCRVFRSASIAQKLEVLRAHPDLAGKLAQAKKLTKESTSEQASAGLDALTDEEREHFTKLNEDYTTKFGHPFIIAVKGLTKSDIRTAFEARIHNDADQEFRTACEQVEKIALLRLKDKLP